MSNENPIDKLCEKGVKVFAVSDDLKERGINDANCLGSVQLIPLSDVAGLLDKYDQVWHW